MAWLAELIFGIWATGGFYIYMTELEEDRWDRIGRMDLRETLGLVVLWPFVWLISWAFRLYYAIETYYGTRNRTKSEGKPSS